MVDAHPQYSLPAGTQEVEDKGRYGGNELVCTLHGKIQVTTANDITGLGDKPQIFDCGIYNVLGEARPDGHQGPSSPGEFPVGSFEFFTPDGAWDPECVDDHVDDECAQQRCTGHTTAEGCDRCCGGVMRLPTGRTSKLATHIDEADGSSSECVSPTGGDECANQQCTYEQTAKGCASCCGGVLRHPFTCYTLYDGVVLNPTDKAECE